jgi:uncharacterized protein (TIGR03032 family)
LQSGEDNSAAPTPLVEVSAAKPEPLRSVHTTSIPQILQSARVSLTVSTYQAGKLVLLRAEPRVNDSPVLNTHFRTFQKPMGVAWEPGRMAVGAAVSIWELHDIPAAAPKLDTAESPAKHDACFLPRSTHTTGNIQVHEMAWVKSSKGKTQSELWFVNTRFSCLAIRSDLYSFVPCWHPPFISAFAPEDRCHLNGLGVRDGLPRYVTALGATDTRGGWRDNKRSGGVLIDISNNHIITTGLSMPHSPRWHAGKLWVLESGNGGVGIVDPRTGKYEEICRLPGFTRGLDFVGPYAFVGLSQVRETAVFSGIAIAEMPQDERACGVWAVDTRSGKIAGFVKFTEGVQEIFAVQALSGLCWPDVITEGVPLSETFELPDEALRQVPAALRSSVPAKSAERS